MMYCINSIIFGSFASVNGLQESSVNPAEVRLTEVQLVAKAYHVELASSYPVSLIFKDSKDGVTVPDKLPVLWAGINRNRNRFMRQNELLSEFAGRKIHTVAAWVVQKMEVTKIPKKYRTKAAIQKQVNRNDQIQVKDIVETSVDDVTWITAADTIE